MSVIRAMNVATTTDAFANKQFNVTPAGGAIVTFFASCVTSGDVMGVVCGERTLVPADFQPNIEISADVIDMQRDRVTAEVAPGGQQMYCSVTATTAVNVQANITPLG